MTIIYRYIFAILGLLPFCKYKILLFSLVSEIINHSNVMLRRLQASRFVCVYKILRFCANLQKFQTLVPANNSHLKVLTWVCMYVCTYMQIIYKKIKNEHTYVRRYEEGYPVQSPGARSPHSTCTRLVQYAKYIDVQSETKC